MPKLKVKHRNRYPWDDWFAKSFVRLRRDQHFLGEPVYFANQVRINARKRDITVSVSIRENLVEITVTNHRKQSPPCEGAKK